MKVQLPVEAGNKAIQENRLGQLLGNVFAQLQPETAYFGTENGVRTAWAVFDLKDPSQIPVFAEKLFQSVDAKVT